MNVTARKQNGITDYDQQQAENITHMQFEDNFVSKANSQIRNRSFKPPSPLFTPKTNEDDHKNGSLSNIANGRIAAYVNEVISRKESIKSTRSRRTSTPPFSTVGFDEIECNTPKPRLQSANSQASLNSSSPLSVSSSGSRKGLTKKRSSSSFMKKLSFRFRSTSTSNTTNSPTEHTRLNDHSQSANMNSFSNKYGSTSVANRTLASTATQTTDNNNNTSNLNFTNSHAKKDEAEASQLDRDAMRKVFNVFDSDHDGSITIDDVEKVMNSLQHLKNEIEMPSVEQIKVAFDKFDANKNGSIEFEEFLEILRCAGQVGEDSRLTSKSSKNIVQTTNVSNTTDRSVKTNMRVMFEQFDKDNDGKITKHELNFVMQNLFPDEVITDRDIDDMLRAADLDQNGFIDFDEFANMFMLHSTNTAVVQSSIEPAFTVPNGTNQYYTKKNTSITNLKSSEPLTKSSRSLSKTLSRSSSKEPRSRNPSGQRSEHNSPHTFRKVVQYFTASQMMDLKAAFHMFDKNRDQKISEKELFEVMKYLGVDATEKEVKTMIQVVDKNKNGCVDYDEFIHMMTKTQLKPLSQEEELRKTFNIFDIDGNGLITHDEIKQTMTHLGENISDKEVKEMIKAADKNGDGKIDINEFSGLLNGTNVFKA